MTLDELYEYAESENIDIYAAALPLTQSMSIMDDDLNCYVGLDYDQISTTAEEKRKLAHEIGHCMKGAFYNRHSKLDLISKHEYSADKWACENLLPKADMLRAFELGYVEVWQLAEYFDVPEELVRKAAWIYFDKTL